MTMTAKPGEHPDVLVLGGGLVGSAVAYGLASGMGPCHARQCGLTVTEIIAQARQVAPETVGYYRIRPPIKPLTLGELAGAAEETP
jgi:glycine/D-amino acid oxidase-like deaminating enzyme